MIDLAAALRACTPAERELVARHAASAAEQTAARAPDSRVVAVWQALGVLAGEPGAPEVVATAAAAPGGGGGDELGRLRAALAWVVGHHEALEGRLGSDAEAEAVFLAALDGRDPRELLMPLATLAVTLARELAERTGDSSSRCSSTWAPGSPDSVSTVRRRVTTRRRRETMIPAMTDRPACVTSSSSRASLSPVLCRAVTSSSPRRALPARASPFHAFSARRGARSEPREHPCLLLLMIIFRHWRRSPGTPVTRRTVLAAPGSPRTAATSPSSTAPLCTRYWPLRSGSAGTCALMRPDASKPTGTKPSGSTPRPRCTRRSDNIAAVAVALGQTGRRSAGGPFHVGGGQTTYRRGDPHGPSWVRDMVAAQLHNDPGALDRLRSNAGEVAVEHRALSTVDGGIGEFVPPLWMVDQWVQLARAGRVVADQVVKQPLPPGTDTIMLPRLATGTAVAEQAVQNTAVQNTDATSDSVSASVATIAGQQVVSLQLIEQSPIAVDQVLLGDLLADLARKVDVFVISNNATGKVGLLNVVGANAITYTSASPTVAGLYPKIADAFQQVLGGRFLPPQKIFMHPRRWAWMLAAADSSSRPLVLPEANMPQNALATATGGVGADGLVGSVMGMPVYVDANLPTNLGAGTNEDRIVVARTDDVILFESAPRAEVFREPKADQMSILLRTYVYLALHAGRYPKSLSVIQGSGLVQPAF